MQRNCQEILENDRLIVSFKKNDQLAEAGVYDCLRQLFRRTYLRLLTGAITNEQPNTPEQLMAEESFDDAYMLFRQNIQDGTFTAEGGGKPRAAAGGYFYNILWKKFQNEKKKRYNRLTVPLTENLAIQPARLSQDMPAFNTKDGIQKMMAHCVNLLEGECRAYMQLQYIDQKSTGEIIDLTQHKTAGTVRKDLAKCRTLFLEKMKTTYGIEF